MRSFLLLLFSVPFIAHSQPRLVVPIGHISSTWGGAFSSDSKMLATFSEDNTIMIWSMANGKLLQTLYSNPCPVFNCWFSKDNTLIYAYMCVDSSIHAWNINSGLEVPVMKEMSDSKTEDKFIKIQDKIVIVSRKTGDTIAYFNDPNWQLDVELSSNEKFIATSSENGSAVYEIKGRKFETLFELKRPARTDFENFAGRESNWIDFSPDNNLVATSWYNNDIAVFDIEGHLKYELKSAIRLDPKLYVDNKNDIISSSGSLSKDYSWDLGAGQFVSYTRYKNAKLDSIYSTWADDDSTWSFSPGSQYKVSRKMTGTIVRIQDIKTGKWVADIQNSFLPRDRIKYNSQGTMAAIIEKTSYQIPGRDNENKSFEVNIVGLATGKIVHNINDSSLCWSDHTDINFSKDGNYVGIKTSRARIWNTVNWKLMLDIPVHCNYSGLGYDFSQDNKRILVCAGGQASVFESYSSQLLFSLPGLTRYAVFNKDNKYIITNSFDNQTRIWKANTGELLYTYFAFENNDYLVLDKEGRYDGSEKARKELYYVCGDEIIQLDQFKELCWQPGLASKIMGSDPLPIVAEKLSEIDICGQTPVVEQEGLKAGVYHYRITPRAGGLGEVQIFLVVDGNEKLLQTFSPSKLIRAGNQYMLRMNKKEFDQYLVSGSTNELSVRATTRDKNMISRGGTVNVVAEKKVISNPNVYLLSIGVSQYKSNDLQLFYASKDANDFANAMNSSAKKLLNTDGNEHVLHYTYTTDSDSSHWPRKKNIMKALEEISKKAVAEDILVIFFAGHGATKTNSKNLYLLTAEASSANMTGVEKQVSISFEELKAWMQKIKANKQVVILDACFSGLAVDNLSPLTTKRALPDDQIRAVEDLKDKTGTYLLSASSAVQPGYEASAYNQGILTYCLLSSIKMGDALKENKFIDVTQWFNSTAKNVKVMARDLGKVQDPRILGNASFHVGMVDKEVLDGIRLSGKKKVFGRSSFVKQGLVPSDNQLELSKSINKSLNEQSLKGRESLIAFAPDNILEDAFTIVGNYEINGNQVTAKCYLLMGKDEKPIFEFQKPGTIDKIDNLAREIVEEAQKYFNK